MENAKGSGSDLLNELYTEISSDKPYFDRKKITLLIFLVISLSVTNTISAVNRINKLYETIQGLPTKKNTILIFSILNFVLIPISALIVSAFASLFPFKGLSYQKKFIPFSLIIALILYVVEVGFFVFD